jgi:anti-sigma regulatory factor (Ser/Thr protein kinase)
VPGADFTTMCAAWIGPHTARVRVASAGHPPPLRIDGDGVARLVEGGLRPPLGCLPHRSAPEEVEIELHGGATLLLYTDGLVERRARSIDEGLDELASIASARHDRSLEVFTAQLVSELTADIDLHDDVAVLALRAASARRGPYRRRVAAVAANLASFRSDLRQWLAPLGVGPFVEADVLLAVGEACANAVEHGSGSRPGATVLLSLALDGGDLVAVVDDEGSWLDRPSSPDRGRGLGIMRDVCRTVDIAAHTGGTTVTMRLDLTPR